MQLALKVVIILIGLMLNFNLKLRPLFLRLLNVNEVQRFGLRIFLNIGVPYVKLVSFLFDLEVKTFFSI